MKETSLNQGIYQGIAETRCFDVMHVDYFRIPLVLCTTHLDIASET